MIGQYLKKSFIFNYYQNVYGKPCPNLCLSVPIWYNNQVKLHDLLDKLQLSSLLVSKVSSCFLILKKISEKYHRSFTSVVRLLKKIKAI